MTRHEASVGDELLVHGHLFIITHLRVELNQLPVLIVEPPLALTENSRR